MTNRTERQRDRLIQYLTKRNPAKIVTLDDVGLYYALKLIDEKHNPICYEWKEDEKIRLYNGSTACVKILDCSISEVDENQLIFHGKPLSIGQLKKYVNKFT